MHLANKDSVVKEMQSLMKVKGKDAWAIIDELNVKGAYLWHSRLAYISILHASSLSMTRHHCNCQHNNLACFLCWCSECVHVRPFAEKMQL